MIDNCQHVLLRCCVNLMDFYGRLGVADRIQFHKQFFFIEPGGRTSVLQAGGLPAPLHFTGSFSDLTFLGMADKVAIASAMWAIRREHGTREDLDRSPCSIGCERSTRPSGRSGVLESGSGERRE